MAIVNHPDNKLAYELDKFWQSVVYYTATRTPQILIAAASFLQNHEDNSLLLARHNLCETLYNCFPVAPLVSDEGTILKTQKHIAALVDLIIAKICLNFPKLPYTNVFWQRFRTEHGTAIEFPDELKADFKSLAQELTKSDKEGEVFNPPCQESF